MSIINQALKKAEREQLLRHGSAVPLLAHVQPLTPHQRRWWLLPAGFVTAISLGIVLHAWLLAPVPRSVPPAPTRQAPPRVLSPPGATDSGATLRSMPADTAVALGLSPAQAQARQVLTPPPGEPQTVPSVPTVAASSPALPPARPSSPAERLTLPTPDNTPALTPPAPVPRLQTVPASPLPVSRPGASAQAQRLVTQALAAEAQGDLPQALRLLEGARTLEPTSKTVYNSLGNVYYQQQQYQQALHMYERALGIDPDDAKARNNLGSTYMQLAIDDRAIEELQYALRIDPAYSLAYYNLACLHARAGRSREAVDYLQQAVALEPEARNWARSDADFAPVRSAPEVRHLLGP